MYKCKVDSKISYQQQPCKGNTKVGKVVYKKKQTSEKSQCQIKCRSDYTVCLGNQDGSWGRDKGLALCKKEKKACNTNCVDPEEGERLLREVGLERKLFQIDKRHQNKLRAIDRESNRKAQARNKRNKCRGYRNQKADLAEQKRKNIIHGSEYTKERLKLDKRIRMQCGG